MSDKGCHVFLTNSNHSIVENLYHEFKYEVIQTKRHISCDSKTRKGEDVIISNTQKNEKFSLNLEKIATLPEQIKSYPSTRYMGMCSRNYSLIFWVSLNNLIHQY